MNNKYSHFMRDFVFDILVNFNTADFKLVSQLAEKSSFRYKKVVNSCQSKSSFAIVNLRLWGKKSYREDDGSNNVQGISFWI